MGVCSSSVTLDVFRISAHGFYFCAAIMCGSVYFFMLQGLQSYCIVQLVSTLSCSLSPTGWRCAPALVLAESRDTTHRSIFSIKVSLIILVIRYTEECCKLLTCVGQKLGHPVKKNDGEFFYTGTHLFCREFSVYCMGNSSEWNRRKSADIFFHIQYHWCGWLFMEPT